MTMRLGNKGLYKGRTHWLVIGAALLLAAAALAVRNLWEQQEAKRFSSRLLVLAEQRLPDGGGAQQTAAGNDGGMEMPAVSPDMTDPLAGYAIDGILAIPKLGLELPVLADYSEELLRMSVCLYAQEADSGRRVIAGHNYRDHFGRLNQLTVGDGLTYTTLDGETAAYQVSGLTEIAAGDREALEAGEWDMTLLTCNLDMSRRILVRLEQTE